MDYSRYSFNNGETEAAWQEQSFRMQRPEVPLFHADLEPYQYRWAIELLVSLETIENASDELKSADSSTRLAAAERIAAEYLKPFSGLKNALETIHRSFPGSSGIGSVEFCHNARVAFLSASVLLPALRLVNQHQAFTAASSALKETLKRIQLSGQPEMQAISQVLAETLQEVEP